MKKDEIIELLKEQIKGLRDDNNRLLDQIDALIKEVSSLKEALLQKGESLSKQQRLTKGLAKLVSNTSEQQQAPQSAISEEERQKNLSGSFLASPEVSGKRILLVDDVLTTGSTAKEAARALLAAEAESVDVLVLSITRLKKD